MSESNLIGQQIGRYELREVLGVGGMAVVYRAHQSAPLNRDVALKIVSATLSQNPGYVERFVREAETAASLEHQHIIPIYDFGIDSGAPYIVMRLLPGGSLAERMAHFIQSEGLQPSLGEIATVLQQVASALDYAHSRGVLHRDVKPSNVMFDQQGSAYLLDFGIAKLLEATGALTGTGMSMGTPSYMSPEQWRADELSPATDQYALGAMAYALVTGMPPFDAPTPYAWMHKHLNELPTPAHLRASHVPEALSSVLERAMAKDPADRFESATAFAQAFGRAVRGQEGEPTGFFTRKLPKRRITVPTHPSGSASHPRTPTTLPGVPIYRRPVVWGAGIAALIVAVLAILLLQPGDSGDSVDRAVGQTLTAVAIANAPAEKPQGPIVEVIDPSPTAPSVTSTPLPTDTPISETDTFQGIEGTESVGLPAATSSASGDVELGAIQALIDDAVGTQIAALVPTQTPVPPTPTVIPNPVVADDDAFLGPQDAPVVIVEFSDFQCGFCGRFFEETLPQIRETYPDQVKFVYRDFTIFGEDSTRAAMAAECAHEQDKFWDMHNRIFALYAEDSPPALTQDTLVSLADEIGLDTGDFTTCLETERYLDEVINDYQAAVSYGLQGTPGFVINGVVYPFGAQPFDTFANIIERELASAGVTG